MSSRIIWDQPERVGRYAAEILGNGNWSNYTAIGLEKDGELIAACVYDQYTGPNISIHVAAKPGRRWMTRAFLHAVFAYPFLQLGCRRVTGSVESTNYDALRFDYHIGFEYEATMKEAAPTGDIILLVMWREKCRWLNLKGVQHGTVEQATGRSEREAAAAAAT